VDSYFSVWNLLFMENYHLSIHMAFWKESMINRLSNHINRNRSAAKISQVLCSTFHPPDKPDEELVQPLHIFSIFWYFFGLEMLHKTGVDCLSKPGHPPGKPYGELVQPVHHLYRPNCQLYQPVEPSAISSPAEF